jgi:hypothetical protein
VIDGVTQRDLAERLAGSHALQGFRRVMLLEHWATTEPLALSHGTSAAFVGSLLDQAALELGESGQHGLYFRLRRGVGFGLQRRRCHRHRRAVWH